MNVKNLFRNEREYYQIIDSDEVNTVNSYDAGIGYFIVIVLLLNIIHLFNPKFYQAYFAFGIIEFIILIMILAYTYLDGMTFTGEYKGLDYKYTWVTHSGAYVMLVGTVTWMYGTISLYYHMKKFDVLDQDWLMKVINEQADSSKDISETVMEKKKMEQSGGVDALAEMEKNQSVEEKK